MKFTKTKSNKKKFFFFFSILIFCIVILRINIGPSTKCKQKRLASHPIHHHFVYYTNTCRLFLWPKLSVCDFCIFLFLLINTELCFLQNPISFESCWFKKVFKIGHVSHKTHYALSWNTHNMSISPLTLCSLIRQVDFHDNSCGVDFEWTM